jgi:hypothetical protein
MPLAIAIGRAILITAASHYLTKAVIKTIDTQVAKQKQIK